MHDFREYIVCFNWLNNKFIWTVVHLPMVFINTSLTSATCIWKSELVMPLARDLRHSASHLLI